MFNFSYDQLILVGKVVGAIVTIAGAIGAALRWWIIPAYTRASNNIKYLFKIAKNADNIHSIIEKELTHNGGSSLKDAVRRIENGLHSHHNKFRSYLSLQKQPIWESDANGNCHWVNDAYTRLTGYSLDHLRNMGWMMVIKKTERSYIEGEWMRSIQQKRTFNHLLTLVDNNGNEHPVYAHGYPVLTHTGEIDGYIGIFDAVPIPCSTEGCANLVSCK